MIANTYSDDDPNAKAAFAAAVWHINTDEKDRDGTINDTGQLIAETDVTRVSG
jgi:hypothetical protein